MTRIRLRKRRVAIAALGLLSIALVWLLVWPLTLLSETSPDGRFQVWIKDPGLLMWLGVIPASPGLCDLKIKDITTGKVLIVEEPGCTTGIDADNPIPKAIVWHPDSKRFVYVYTILGAPFRHSFRVSINPLAVKYDDGKWLVPLLRKNLHSPNRHQRAVADELIDSITY